MAEKKDLELTSTHEHTKITTKCKTTMDEKIRTYQKISTTKDIKKEPQ